MLHSGDRLNPNSLANAPGRRVPSGGTGSVRPGLTRGNGRHGGCPSVRFGAKGITAAFGQVTFANRSLTHTSDRYEKDRLLVLRPLDALTTVTDAGSC